MPTLGVDLDMAKTAKEANYYLKWELPHDRNLAGLSFTQLSSPQITGMPANHSTTNGVENGFIKMASGPVQAYARCQAVAMAIDTCSDSPTQPYKTILKMYYLGHRSLQVIADKLGYSLRRVKQFKTEALCEFAERVVKYSHDYGAVGLKFRVYEGDKS